MRKIGLHALVCLLAGLWLLAVGLGIASLAMSSIAYWMPERMYACFEHSGEFDELFMLYNLGRRMELIGSLLIVVCSLILVAHVSACIYEKRRKKA